MDEQNGVNRPKDPKEETIDILVSPKEERPAEPTPARKAPARPAADATRKVSAVPSRPRQDRAEETRVTAPAVVPKEKKAAPAPKAPAAKAPRPAKEKKQKEPEERDRGALISTLIRASLYILFVVGVSALLSTFAIRWANDVFALVKDEVTAQITIPENATIAEVSGILKENGIIEYPRIFQLYIGYRHRNDDPALSFKAGEYEVASTLNYDQITNMIKLKSSRQIIKLTIPEGLTVDETIDLFLENGIGTREGFVAAINEYPYTYTFMEHLNSIQFAEGRTYRLEGYLFPNTYEFYTDSSEVAIIDKMLTSFEAHFERAYYDRCVELNMNLDQVITLASMVQMEGRTLYDFYSISGVFYNRLASSEYPYLQSDATVQYAIHDHKTDLSGEDLAVDSPYNTYRTRGLPPGPISNPGWDAIQAALYPESNNYYFFIANVDGTTLFARTLPEHQKNAAIVNAARAAAANN